MCTERTATSGNGFGRDYTTPRPIGEVLKNYFETSNEPLAIAYRKRMATKAIAEKGDKE